MILTDGRAAVQFHLEQDEATYSITASAPGRREFRGAGPLCACTRTPCLSGHTVYSDRHGYAHCHGQSGRHPEHVASLAAAVLRSYAGERRSRLARRSV